MSSPALSEPFAIPESGPEARGPILLGVVVAAVFLGCFGGWAALAPLSSAALADGVVRVEGHSKTVQHMEGGIIRQILVKEGDQVQKGQLLLRIDDTQAAANLAQLRLEHDALEALEARLLAERDGRALPEFPAGLQRTCADPARRTICGDQERILADRQKSLEGQVQILKQRVDQLHSEIDAHRAQAESAAAQKHAVDEEINGVAPLVKMNLLPRPRLLSLQREAANLDGIRGEQLALIAKAEQSIGETQLQIGDTLNKHQTEVATDLHDTEDKLADTAEKLRAAADVQHRTDVVAPEAGKIVNLRYFTPGGVVKPGDPILDIVPQNENLIVEAQIRPLDIESVHRGLEAEVRLPAYRRRRLPLVEGTVTYVSADTLTDTRTGQSYYAAHIEIPPQELARLDGVSLYPGMPAEILIITGKRTLLQYLLDPVEDSFSRAFREK